MSYDGNKQSGSRRPQAYYMGAALGKGRRGSYNVSAQPPPPELYRRRTDAEMFGVQSWRPPTSRSSVATIPKSVWTHPNPPPPLSPDPNWDATQAGVQTLARLPVRPTGPLGRRVPTRGYRPMPSTAVYDEELLLPSPPDSPIGRRRSPLPPVAEEEEVDDFDLPVPPYWSDSTRQRYQRERTAIPSQWRQSGGGFGANTGGGYTPESSDASDEELTQMNERLNQLRSGTGQRRVAPMRGRVRQQVLDWEAGNVLHSDPSFGRTPSGPPPFPGRYRSVLNHWRSREEQQQRQQQQQHYGRF